MLDLIQKLRSEAYSLSIQYEDEDEYDFVEVDVWDLLAKKYEELSTGGFNCVWDLGDGTLLRWPKQKLSVEAEAHIALTELNLLFVPKLLKVDDAYTIVEKADAIPLYKYGIITPKISETCLNALSELHKHGWVHNDLNCGNILIGREGEVWLIDFDRAYYVAQSVPGQYCFANEYKDMELMLSRYLRR